MRRALLVPVRVMYGYFGPIAAACVGGLVHPALTAFPRSALYGVLMLAGMAPTLGGTLFLLLRYHARASAEERARTKLVLWAIVLGSAFAVVDLLAAALERPVPRVAPAGFLVSAFFLAAVALRFRLFEGRSPLALLNTVAVATIGILAELALARALRPESAFFGLATAVVTLSVLGAARQIFLDYARQRADLHYHATLGRLSAQMAHDIRNPLAAIRGAAQFLGFEREAGRSLDPHGRYLEVIVQQADRIAAIVERYQRIGRVEPVLAVIDLNELALATVTAQRSALGSAFTLDLRLAGDAPRCKVDRELLSEALENLLRNAREAMPEGGLIEVATGRTRGLFGANDGVFVRVHDEGPGMDVRQRELSFEPFFSTKPGGSGLGLPFVRRVAEACGGRAFIEPSADRGTAVRIELPAEGPP